MGDHAEFAGTYLVTPNFFPVFGVAPTFGRAFETNDAQRAAIVSLPFATRNFGSGAAALGQTLHVERVGYLQAGRLFENAVVLAAAIPAWRAARADPVVALRNE